MKTTSKFRLIAVALVSALALALTNVRAADFSSEELQRRTMERHAADIACGVDNGNDLGADGQLCRPQRS